jgi:hypothetical protein
MSYSSGYIVWQGKQILPPQLITEDHKPRLPQIKLAVYCQRSDPQDLAQMVVQELHHLEQGCLLVIRHDNAE